ncbi:hypothetical protein PJ261_02295 [Streptococcus dysgalactiae]|uniref:hypothetical protein n=1 Tax=Streptococcus dysgalactiae TaxID=1334 RepID=UPI0035D08A30
MNGIKENTRQILTISDLKQLGKEGGTTARLETGEEVTLKANYGTVIRQAIVDGQRMEVDVMMFYPELYKQIRTLKRNHLLIARRVKIGKRKILQLTGKGYHRPN